MDPITQQTVLAAAGAAGGDKVYVDDVFSTFLWQGTGSSQTINNGIDLAGEGGLVWSKNRGASTAHLLNDSERGIESGSYYSELVSNTSAVNEKFTPWGATSFNNNGFSLGGNNSQFNLSGSSYVSWTFRKAPGFFDVVTYTGNGTAGRTVAHDLGSVPGMIIVKCLDETEPWCVYHRSLGNNTYLSLSETSAGQTSTLRWNDTTPTSSVFTVGTDPNVNQNTKTYVAYIFAHDDAQYGTDSDESIIKCGSYTGNGSTTGTVVNLGFEPQFVLIKNVSNANQWMMFDNMRGIASGGNDPYLHPSDTDAEYAGADYLELTSTGFQLKSTASTVNNNGATFIYMAIRRPNKPPGAATDVFAVDTGNSSSTIPCFDSGFPVDFAFRKSAYASTGNNPRTHSRLQGPKELYTALNISESSSSDALFDSMTGMSTGFNSNDIAWMFKRAPGFMDVVAYTGEGGSNRSVAHNLTVTPTFWITKKRSGSGGWFANYTVVDGSWDYLRLDHNGSASGVGGGLTLPTSTAFFVDSSEAGASDVSGENYIAFLFATLPGISKVGSYSGTGSAINVDCGFTNGARFILIKRSDSTGDWYVWDTTRGIVSGNDPYLLLNDTAAQVTNTDYIDPLNAGFTVTSSAPAALNASGGTYIFLAIA